MMDKGLPRRKRRGRAFVYEARRSQQKTSKGNRAVAGGRHRALTESRAQPGDVGDRRGLWIFRCHTGTLGAVPGSLPMQLAVDAE